MATKGEDTFRLAGQILEQKYCVSRVVERGGFGVVYCATHRSLGSQVAIKCLRLDANEDEKEQISRFFSEARLMHDLSRADSAVAQVLDFSIAEIDGKKVPYMVLEWIEGEPLDRFIDGLCARGERMTPSQLVDVLGPVARALAFAHRKQVAHRDIKPSNILLSADPGVGAKILDFGLAKPSAGRGSETTRQGEASYGLTPRYAAPEQWVARYGATGLRTDVFSFALTCVECLSGQHALPGRDHAQWMGACLDAGRRPTPRGLGVDLGEQIEQVFARALAVHPGERHEDVGAFWAELSAAIRALGSPPEAAPLFDGTGTIRGEPLDNPSGAGLRTVVTTGPALSAAPYAPTPAPPAPTPHIPPAPPPARTGKNQGIELSWEGLAAAPKPVLYGLIAVVGLMVLGVTGTVVGRLRGPSEELAGLSIPSLSSAEPGTFQVGGSTAQTAPSGSAFAGGFLSVYCVPSCDQILLDGEALGPSPLLRRPVSAGQHRLAARRPGATSERRIQVNADQEIAERWLEP